LIHGNYKLQSHTDDQYSDIFMFCSKQLEKISYDDEEMSIKKFICSVICNDLFMNVNELYNYAELIYFIYNVKFQNLYKR
jgi:hypothetical protein